MNRRFYRAIGALVCITILGGLLAARSLRSHTSSGTKAGKTVSALPTLMLWAWERPEDLSFIDTSRVGIAYLAGTIRIDSSRVTVIPRFQPLKAPDSAQLIAVIRIEAEKSAALDHIQIDDVVTQVLRLGLAHAVRAVQIDFDASKSQRAFYEALLRQMRNKLPDGIPLTITALASWCMYDDWIDHLPIDDAVPMVFRMGADRLRVLSHLESGGDFRSSRARSSIGISVDEEPEILPHGRRIYAFNPKPWSRQSVDEVLREVAQWK